MKEKEVKHNVLKNSLEDIMADRFARYSKYIIQERALPDARDGLKPVQRRILYAMYEDGNTYNKPYHKSAKTVGNVIGNYHPHGDSSVYDAMVRMSQNWKITNPLIDSFIGKFWLSLLRLVAICALSIYLHRIIKRGMEAALTSLLWLAKALLLGRMIW